MGAEVVAVGGVGCLMIGLVPVAGRLGEEGQGLKIALERAGWRADWVLVALAVGLAQGALEWSVKFARARAAFWENDWGVSGDSVDAGGYVLWRLRRARGLRVPGGWFVC